MLLLLDSFYHKTNIFRIIYTLRGKIRNTARIDLPLNISDLDRISLIHVY